MLLHSCGDLVTTDNRQPAPALAFGPVSSKGDLTMKYTLRQIIRYKFDNFMAKGGRSIFISLVVVFVALLALVACLRGIVVTLDPNVYVERVEEGGRVAKFFSNIYITFLQMTDPGNMGQDIESDPYIKVFAVLAGLIGVVMLSALIAFITNALDQKLQELKKGHSKVIERRHTLILGWNERVVEILRELVLANESEDNPCAVILSNEDKEQMDDFIKLHLPNPLNTRIVTRSGGPSSLVNLDTVSVDTCKSVIVLAECNPGAEEAQKQASDAIVIKTVLAVVASRSSDEELNIVAEVFDERNRRIVEEVSPESVTTVDTDDILAKILVQTSRSVGLSVVYSEILSFDGCEMYFCNYAWSDITFADLGYRFPDGVPMGLRHADGTLVLNPSVDTKLAEDDDVLILAEDDSTIDFRPKALATPRDEALAGGRQEQTIERELIIGWTSKVETIIEQYADYVLEGSRIDIMLRTPDDAVRTEIERIQERLSNVAIRLIEEDPLRTEGLMAVRPFEYDNIIILSQSDERANAEQIDSETIVILLLLRNIFNSCPQETPTTKLITEVLDSDNQELVARAGVHDFIISNRYISMLLAQVSEDSDIKRVYDDLFQEEGSEIYLKPASLYFTSFPQEATFADIMWIAQKREEVCLGVKIKALEKDGGQNFGVKLIPEKNTSFALEPDDALVVLAVDET